MDQYIKARAILLGWATQITHRVLVALESFKRRREKAGILLSYVGEAKSRQAAEEALRVYRAWLNGKLTYREALARIKRLAGGR
ncbi:MAG: hypothetical protein GSR85_01470 [Desulfurococcales archaeon]|nr:hypothetical protein [Desulfurococcales archaeon]